MDPKATLLQARNLIDNDAAYEEAAELLSAYANWRFSNGYEPIVPELGHMRGDKLFSHLMTVLGQCADLEREEAAVSQELMS